MKTITKYKKDDNFHTTLINAIFQIKCDKSEIMALTILSKLLLKTNRKYNTEDAFSKEKLNRYIMSFNILTQPINNIYFLNISILLPNPGLIKEYKIEDAVNFMLDTIYDNNLNDVDLFLREKRLYIESLLDMYKNIEFVAEKNMLDLLDQDCIFNKISFKDLDNINNLSLDDVIKFFDKYIKDFMPKIFVYGNILEKEVEDIFSNYFSDMKLKSTKLLKDYDVFYSSEETLDITHYSKFNQSVVYMVYGINKYNRDDFYKLYLINLLLYNSSSDLLYNNLRKKYNLVYSCGSSVMIRNGLLIIKVLTCKSNIKIAKGVIDKIINDLKNTKIYSDNIDRILNNFENNLIREKDNFFIKPGDIINEYFESDISSEEVLNILKNITLDELNECINRLELKCIYTLEGV